MIKLILQEDRKKKHTASPGTPGWPASPCGDRNHNYCNYNDGNYYPH